MTKSKSSIFCECGASGADSGAALPPVGGDLLSPDISMIERSTSSPVLVPEPATSTPARCERNHCPRGGGRGRRVGERHSTTSLVDFDNGSIKSDYKNSQHGSLPDSPSASSVAGSGAGSGQCSAVTRALHYHNKLMATLQILDNKEETIRVQTESLRVAESRIASLTARAEGLRQELQEKGQKLRLLQATEGDKASKTSISVSADIEEHQKVVGTLQTSLAVIEELYAECFYEAAKQEQLIELLRTDMLDVRLLEKKKDSQIQKLQSVVNTQQWSLERCQDIAVEVDNLKTEISNFLNSSNNDSGMWERDSSPSQGDAAEDLREISAQLLQLQEMLAHDCTCGLEEENNRLKQENQTMQKQIADLQQRLSEQEVQLKEKESMERKHSSEIEQRDEKLSSMSLQLEQLVAQERSSQDLAAECEQLKHQLKQMEVMLSDKCAELMTAQRLQQQEQSTVRELKEELARAGNLVKENTKIRDEVSELRAQVRMWRDHLVSSERAASAAREQLQRARDLCRDVDASYREKVRCACSLQRQLTAAQERGAALCDDARRVLRLVRRWAAASAGSRRDQEQKIKEQEDVIKALQRRLDDKLSERSSFEQPCCEQCVPRRRAATDGIRDVNRREQGSCSRLCEGVRRERSATETASGSSAPVPPLRVGRRKSSEERVSVSSLQRDVSAQLPVRADASADTSGGEGRPAGGRDADVRHLRVIGNPFRRSRDLSPTSELEARMLRLNEALSNGHRRWTRMRSSSHTR